METNNHKILKFKALEYLFLTKKCKYVTTELKFGNYIFDCIGSDGQFIYIVEAKQSRDDFFADCNKKEDIRENIQKYKKLLKETADVKKYKDLIEKEQNKSWKFYDESIFKMTIERFIIVPEGLVVEKEVPENWGLLEVDEEGKIFKEKKSTKGDYDRNFKDLIIKEIARRNTKLFLESLDVSFEEKTIVFPNLLLE